ncbi:hypothetical protein VFPPC_02916 [Pochonia chlamydosporia 170]|uniref:DUF4037 domain-containing protein n=1 Tax=Pochonia chlamydosporia 170 TaxID=1380566 RepID=A0A179FYI4_METCM|nr:hypothetical protein VFPPC_02916 [Pochonia chlamydosporia 170]OAQ70447.1 hypothetical protein VFPPC_02916 [Pochonia chlamydosporia 170]
MPSFIPGLELNRKFHDHVVRPLLAAEFPDLQYDAALIGPGSEVLGFDTEMSMDHDWGLHFFIFVREEHQEQCQVIANMLSHKLPESFLGFPVSIPPVSPKPGVRVLDDELPGPIKHHITPMTLNTFVVRHLGLDVTKGLDSVSWLTLPTHAIGEVVAGEIYHSGLGDLSRLRDNLSWYPHDVWLYLLASGWQRLSEEEHLMPRAAYAGSELGSALIGSRLVRDVMNLCFLMERRYAPYPKWFGLAFRQLQCGPLLEPILLGAQQASTWRERQEFLAQAYEVLAKKHNALGIGKALPDKVSYFHDRPFKVVHGELFAEEVFKQITDVEVRRIAAQQPIGSLSQWADNTSLLDGKCSERIRGLYE